MFLTIRPTQVYINYIMEDHDKLLHNIQRIYWFNQCNPSTKSQPICEEPLHLNHLNPWTSQRFPKSFGDLSWYDLLMPSFFPYPYSTPGDHLGCHCHHSRSVYYIMYFRVKQKYHTHYVRGRMRYDICFPLLIEGNTNIISIIKAF